MTIATVCLFLNILMLVWNIKDKDTHLVWWNIIGIIACTVAVAMHSIA